MSINDRFEGYQCIPAEHLPVHLKEDYQNLPPEVVKKQANPQADKIASQQQKSSSLKSYKEIANSTQPDIIDTLDNPSSNKRFSLTEIKRQFRKSLKFFSPTSTQSTIPEPLQQQFNCITTAPYFNQCSASDAQEFIKTQPTGTFVVRLSSYELGYFVLTYKTDFKKTQKHFSSIIFFISPEGKIQIPPTEKNSGRFFETMTENAAFFSGEPNATFQMNKKGLLDAFYENGFITQNHLLKLAGKIPSYTPQEMLKRVEEIKQHVAFQAVDKSQANEMLKSKDLGTYLIYYEATTGSYWTCFVSSSQTIMSHPFFITPIGKLQLFLRKEEQIMPNIQALLEDFSKKKLITQPYSR